MIWLVSVEGKRHAVEGERHGYAEFSTHELSDKKRQKAEAR
jgi:hypothetical protein